MEFKNMLNYRLDYYIKKTAEGGIRKVTQVELLQEVNFTGDIKISIGYIPTFGRSSRQTSLTALHLLRFRGMFRIAIGISDTRVLLFTDGGEPYMHLSGENVNYMRDTVRATFKNPVKLLLPDSVGFRKTHVTSVNMFTPAVRVYVAEHEGIPCITDGFRIFDRGTHISTKKEDYPNTKLRYYKNMYSNGTEYII